MDHSSTVSLTAKELDGLQKSVAAIQEAYRLVQKEGAQFIVVLAQTTFRVYQDIANFEKAGGDIKRWELNEKGSRKFGQCAKW